MAHKLNFSLENYRLQCKQKGAVLIFMAFILVLGAAVYLLNTFNAANVIAKQDGSCQIHTE